MSPNRKKKKENERHSYCNKDEVNLFWNKLFECARKAIHADTLIV